MNRQWEHTTICTNTSQPLSFCHNSLCFSSSFQCEYIHILVRLVPRILPLSFYLMLCCQLHTLLKSHYWIARIVRLSDSTFFSSSFLLLMANVAGWCWCLFLCLHDMLPSGWARSGTHLPKSNLIHLHSKLVHNHYFRSSVQWVHMFLTIFSLFRYFSVNAWGLTKENTADKGT